MGLRNRVIPTLCVLAGCTILGCGLRAASGPRADVTSVGAQVTGTPIADTTWAGLYTGSGDLYIARSGWSRGMPAQVQIAALPGQRPGHLTLHCSIQSDSLLNHGFGLEMLADRGAALQGEAPMPGQVARYELHRRDSDLVGVVKIWNGISSGHPEYIYAFEVTRSVPYEMRLIQAY